MGADAREGERGRCGGGDDGERNHGLGCVHDSCVWREVVKWKCKERMSSTMWSVS